MAITPLPTPPLRSDGPTSFADRGDTFMAALPAFVAEANALEANVDALEASAVASAASALASENAAVSASGAVQWVSGTTYSIGAVRWSPITLLSYRRKVAGAGTTDPSLDAANWAQLTTLPVQTGAGGKFLTTDGSAASWADTPVAPATTQQILTFTPISGTYARAASQASATAVRVLTTVTITKAAHGYLVGDWVYLDFSSTAILDGWYEIATAATDSFTVTTAASGSASITATIHAPIIVTATAHGLANGASVFVDWTSGSATSNPGDGGFTVRQSTANTFQAIATYSTLPAATSGNCNLPQVGNSAQTWTKPAGCRAVEVELTGGGGGASSSSTGGGGGYSRKFIDASGLSTVAVTIGFPGVANLATHTATAGATSSFGAHLSATGGSAVAGVATSGIGSGGGVNLLGGANAGTISNAGASPLGSGVIITSGADAVIAPASGFGGGGVAYSGTGIVSPATPGVVIVKEYY